MSDPHAANDRFIVDNSDTDGKVGDYLKKWCALSRTVDIAAGYFEIGALLALGGTWSGVKHLRILLGDEVSLRTQRVFAESLRKIQQRLEASAEEEKRRNDFLQGAPAIVEAMRAGQIQCRVYRKEKFHAKCYLTHAPVVGSFGLVGSSNFTVPGLSQNIELNVQIRGPEVDLLQEWYDRHWEVAEEVTPDLLRILERHTEPRSPFEIWFKALDEFFRGRELTPDGWDQQESRMFSVLDKYQQDAYRNLLTIAQRFQGAFLCDGVGLGKTFVGLMLLERMVVHAGQRVVLFAPKAAREDVWEPAIERYLPHLNSRFVNFVLFNHTDLQRKNTFQRDLELTLRDADVVIIDEAHHFRNPGVKGEGIKEPSRYRKLQTLLQTSRRPKTLFLLTATPVNNSVQDFRRMIELFTGGDERYFTGIGIHSLPRYFADLEKQILGKLPSPRPVGEGPGVRDLEFGPEILEVEKTLHSDLIFESLVVQRSRGYVKRSQQQQGSAATLFPERAAPQVVPYNLKATYGRLLDSVERAFNKKKPLFVLGIYYPLAYWKGDKNSADFQKWDEGRQKQVVILIRTLFLKRFESSAEAFQGSCWRLLQKLLAWVTVHAESDHEKHRVERWNEKNAKLIGYVRTHQQELWPDAAEEDEVEDFLTEDLLNAVKKLDPERFDVGAIFDDCLDDLNQLAEFLELVAEVNPKRDDKLQGLLKKLKTDKVLKQQKLILFTEFADTARYLERELQAAGITGVHRIDGGSSQKQRSEVIHRFAPYYNGSCSAEIAAKGQTEIRVLISTDVLAEGLNLQDALRLINYDLHWNPVRLMQRIGRVDRRLNPAIEAQMVADHPEQAKLRGHVEFWNFLPPDELDELLRLFQRVTHKTLVISRTLGIEGRQLLTPDDAFDPIKELNEQCEGTLSQIEQLRLEYNELVAQYPDWAATLPNLPLKAFSGKALDSPLPAVGKGPGVSGRMVFFCFRIPRPDPTLIDTESNQPRWSEAAGFTVWACYDLEWKRVLTEPGAIAALIRSPPDTPRHCVVEPAALSALRQQVERQLVMEHLKPLQAPVGVDPILKCWMELN